MEILVPRLVPLALIALISGSGLGELVAAETKLAATSADLVIKLPPFDVYASTEAKPIFELKDIDEPPKPTLIRMPVYPPHLAHYLLGARVNLIFVVNKGGVVEDAHAIDVTLVDFSYVAPEELKTSERRRQTIAKEFGDAAVAFAKELRYRPAVKNLKPVATRMTYSLNFRATAAAMPPNAKSPASK
jgi:hypothetical protein